MVFYTDIFAINPAQVGILFMVARFGMHSQMSHGVALLTQEKLRKMGNSDLGFSECPSHLLFWGINVRSYSRNVKWILSCLCICHLYHMGNII